MSQFKRFNASENDNWNTNDAYPQGTLTWDPDNGLRIHDGSTSGGNSVNGWGPGNNIVQNVDTDLRLVVQDPYENSYSIDLAIEDTGGSVKSRLEIEYDHIQIETWAGAHQWRFESGGQFRIPGNINTYDKDIEIIAMNAGTAGNITIKAVSNVNDIHYSQVQLTQSGVNITTDMDVTPGGKTFEFRDTGVLALPSGGDIVDSTGTSVLGGNANTGNVLFDSETLYVNNGVTNTGFINLENDGGNFVIGTNTDASLRISVNGNNIEKGWVFNTDGSITFPDLSTQTTAYTGGGGTTLPLDAAGVLKNDGTGTLSWSSLDIQDLTDNGNLLNFTQQQADWEEMNAASPAYIQNKPTLITSYYQLNDLPTLFNGDYLSLTGTPSLANVATTGMYGDLTGTPTSLSDFTNDPGFISASDLAVSTGGSGSLTYSNGLFTYEGPTVPTDISELTDNTNLLSSGGSGTTLPADASGYLNNDGSGTLSWVPGNPGGSGLLPYSDVKVLSNTTTADWTEFTLSGTMDSMNDYSNSIATITLTSSTAYGKTITANTKNLWVTNAKVNSNDYLVVEFPPSPTVGDIFSVVPVAVTQTVTAGSFVIGETYTIVTVGSTNFTTIGAAMNGTGQVFVATGAGTGTGTATTSAGAKKLIYKPAAGQRARTMYVGNNPPVMFGQGGAYDFVYVDLGGQYANQPATWVYAGLVDSIPTWYHTYF